jgi:Protein of unknown function (DUF3300)
MRIVLRRSCTALVSVLLLGPPGFAQTAVSPPATAPPPPPQLAPAPAPAPAAATPAAEQFNPEQLDALLAPIALYPDALLVQVLMASTYPLQIVAASRWLADDDHKALKGDDLAKALTSESWDPSVKSLLPFPQVLEMMNQQLEWTQQLGYAAAMQQTEVMDSVQRLRLQAQQVGTLKTTEQQVVTLAAASDSTGAPTSQQVIAIQPADPQVVYVPSYNPTTVYGAWPYPATPPVYLPPPPGYAVANAVVTGMAFAAGVAVVGSLWGWATPRWGYGYGGGYGHYGGSINVNTNRYNNITVNNANRANVNGNRWQAPARGPGRPATRPVAGPVGLPARGNGVPANAIGRPNVTVPASAVNRPNAGQGATGANRPNAGQGATGANRPNAGQGAAGANRPNAGQGAAGANRPNAGQGAAVNRPNIGQSAGAAAADRPTRTAAAVPRPARPQGGAFGNINDGARASQFQQRGAQSRSARQSTPSTQPRAAAARGGGRHR